MSTTPIGLAPGAPEEAAGQDEEKYNSDSRIIQTVLKSWVAKLQETMGTLDDDAVIADIGVGEGYCLERFLPDGHAAIGVEYRLDKARVAARAHTPVVAGPR